VAADGNPLDERRPQPKMGWHRVEWACELVGTAFQLFLGFSVVAVLEAPGAPGRRLIGSAGVRLVLIGAAFGVLTAIPTALHYVLAEETAGDVSVLVYGSRSAPAAPCARGEDRGVPPAIPLRGASGPPDLSSAPPRREPTPGRQYGFRRP
jgi:hypothetical protein